MKTTSHWRHAPLLLALTCILAATTCWSFHWSANTVQSTSSTLFIPGEGPEAMPTFPGGQAALVEYMVQHLKYPTAAWEAKKEGRVVIKFTVSRSGAIRKAHVAKGMGYGMDAEALRVVKAMPNWNPAEKDGKVVAVEVSLPVQFALPK